MIDTPFHDDEFDDEEEHDSSRLRERLEALLPNVIKRTVSTGVGAKQMTEGVIRGAIGDMKLPKEAVTYLIDLADNTKKEVVRVAAREFREFLESARFNEELAKILTQLSFEIRTEIRFIPNDQALRPSVKTRARIKSGDDKDDIVDAPKETNERLNEAIRAGASDFAEALLGKMFRDKDEEGAAGEEPAAEAVAEEEEVAAEPVEGAPKPAKKPRAKRKTTTRTRSSRSNKTKES